MDNIELIRNFEHLRTRYRFTYHEFANLIEWEELVRLNWWQRLFRTDGQEFVWKRIYLGHATVNKRVVTVNKLKWKLNIS